jgi:hypothetical protein
METSGRTVIRNLQARDGATGETVRMQPGARIASWWVRRTPAAPAGEEYLAEFESDGRRYRCALAQFLPRTQPAEAVALEAPARKTVAV